MWANWATHNRSPSTSRQWHRKRQWWTIYLKRAIVNETMSRTVSKATLGTFLKDGVERRHNPALCLRSCMHSPSAYTYPGNGQRWNGTIWCTPCKPFLLSHLVKKKKKKKKREWFAGCHCADLVHLGFVPKWRTTDVESNIPWWWCSTDVESNIPSGWPSTAVESNILLWWHNSDVESNVPSWWRSSESVWPSGKGLSWCNFVGMRVFGCLCPFNPFMPVKPKSKAVFWRTLFILVFSLWSLTHIYI